MESSPRGEDCAFRSVHRSGRGGHGRASCALGAAGFFSCFVGAGGDSFRAEGDRAVAAAARSVGGEGDERNAPSLFLLVLPPPMAGLEPFPRTTMPEMPRRRRCDRVGDEPTATRGARGVAETTAAWSTPGGGNAGGRQRRRRCGGSGRSW